MATANAMIPRPAPSRPRRLRRDVGVVGLLFTSVGSIIGSGWLFGALSASKIAGPAALLSWAIGGGAVILLALIHAELGAMYPVAGGSARFPHYAFGSLVGFSAGWFAFLGAVTTAPIEVEAALQYATNYVGGLTHLSGGTPVLTATGYLVAAGLMLLFSAINVMGVKWLSETNKAAVWWKIAIPVVAVRLDSGVFRTPSPPGVLNDASGTRAALRRLQLHCGDRDAPLPRQRQDEQVHRNTNPADGNTGRHQQAGPVDRDRLHVTGAAKVRHLHTGRAAACVRRDGHGHRRRGALPAGGIGYGEVKARLADAIDEQVAPMRNRYQRLLADPAQLDAGLGEGTARVPAC